MTRLPSSWLATVKVHGSEELELCTWPAAIQARIIQADTASEVERELQVLGQTGSASSTASPISRGFTTDETDHFLLQLDVSRMESLAVR